MLELLFWITVSLIIYCYAGYPLAIFLIAKLCPRSVNKSAFTPTVSVVLSVYNEEKVIKQRIENLLSLDYPKEKFDIFIGSDGSNDATSEIIRNFKDDRLKFLESPQRRGKMAMINDLAKASKAEIIVFTDARQTFAKNAIKELVANFADPKVGCVSGELMFAQTDQSTAKGIGLYWQYEKFIRDHESRFHSMLGATGAIYAIRRELFVEIPEAIILDDMFVPLKIIDKGYRAIIDRDAKAYDEAAEDPKKEYRRKVRTLSGNFQIFTVLPKMLVPILSPVALQMLSHKLLRVLVPFLMVVAFAVNVSLIDRSPYLFLLLLQVLFYVIAFLGWMVCGATGEVSKKILKACYLPYIFCLLNFCALVGFLRFMSGGQNVMWKKANE